MNGPLCKITCHKVNDGVVRLELAGEFDLATIDELDRALLAVIGTSAEIYVDLQGVTFIDTTTIASLVNASYQASRAGARLVVLHAHDTVRLVLEVTGVLGRLTDPH